MLRWIIGFSLRARRLVVVLAAGMLVLGVTQFRSMPADVLPEFTPPTVEVQTEALGLSAEEVEQLITVPLEQDLLNGIAFLEDIRSASVPGLSSIQMTFEPGTDLLDARQVVQERLSQAQVALPGVQSSPPQMLQPLSSTSRVMMVSLSSDDVSAIDMSILGRWTIAPKLLGVPGVANVAMWGFRDKQLQVLVDPERLRDNDLTLQQVIETTANAQFVCPLTFEECSTPGTGGLVETSNQRVGVQHIPVTASADDLAQVPVEGAEGLALGDVADVVEDHQVLIGDAVGPDLLLVIEKFPDANTLEVTEGVEDAFEELRPGMTGISVDTGLYRPATYIETSQGNVLGALAIGAALAVLALVLLLFEWRSVVVGAVAILVSLATAALVLSMTEATRNAMVIAGLVLALLAIVDDAIGDTSNLVRRLRERRQAGEEIPAPRIVLEAAHEMRSAAAYAMFIAAVSVIPVLFTQGAFGAFAPSALWSYVVAVVASMVVAVILTPALGLLLLPKVRPERRGSPILRWLRATYDRLLTRSVGSPRLAYVVAAVVLVVGLVTVPFLSRSTVPSFRDTNLLVRLSAASGMSLPEMQRLSGRIAEDVRGIPGVEEVGAHIGRAVLSDQEVNTNAGEIWVTVDPGADHASTVDAVEEVVRAYPGIERAVTTYPDERIADVLSGPQDPVVVRLYGLDFDLLRQKAEEVKDVIAGVDGVVDPRVEPGTLEPSLEIQVDLALAAEHGIKPGDVRRAAATMLSGITVGSLFEEQKVFQVVVWGTPETRSDLTAIDGLLIDTPEGDQVRLGDVADVRIVANPTAIQHDDVQRYVDVTAGASGDLGPVLEEVDDSLAQVEFPLEYHAEVVRDAEELQGADRRAVIAVVVAAIIVFLLLHAGLGHFRVAVMAFGVLILSLTGGAVAVLLTGGTVAFGSVLGFFAVLGIAAKQVMGLMRHYRHLELHEGRSFGQELIIGGTGDRFAPIVTAALTALLLFVPLAVISGAGLEIVQPMAVVVIGGLIVSTVLTLFVVPGLFLRFGEADLESAEVSMERLLANRELEGIGATGGGS